VIYEITEPLLLEPIIKAIEDLGITSQAIAKKIILEEFQNPGRLLLVEEIKDKVTGVYFHILSEYNGENVIFIVYAGAYPDRKNAIFEFLARAKKRAKEMEITKMIFITRRNPKGFARKYKFKPIETVLEYRIKEA